MLLGEEHWVYVCVLTPRRMAVSVSRLEGTAQLRPRRCPAPCHAASPMKPSLLVLPTAIDVLGATKPRTATIWHRQKLANSRAVNLNEPIDVMPLSMTGEPNQIRNDNKCVQNKRLEYV